MIALSFISHAIACSTNEKTTISIYGSYESGDRESATADVNYSKAGPNVHIAALEDDMATALSISSALRIPEESVALILPLLNDWNTDHDQWKATAEIDEAAIGSGLYYLRLSSAFDRDRAIDRLDDFAESVAKMRCDELPALEEDVRLVLGQSEDESDIEVTGKEVGQ